MTAASWLFGAGGLALVAIGMFFAALRPALLPEDLRFLTRSQSEIDEFAPRMRTWLTRIFVVLGGQAIAAGSLTIFVAATGVRDGRAAAVVALALTGMASIGLMAAVNFAIRSDFRWPLLAAAGLWFAAIVVAILS